MNNPAFIVDGFTEKSIVQKLCSNQPIRRTDLNGKGTTISAIAKKIASLIRLLGNKYYPIIILVDKENRNIDFEQMAIQLKESLIAEGITDQDLRIGIADRMIENWMIADWKSLAGPKLKEPSQTDGINGAGLIKKVKKTYAKVVDGTEFFINADPKMLYEKSASYRHFIDQLKDINCNYLSFINNGIVSKVSPKTEANSASDL
jgi:Domain of unknown function (DUF4276)